MIILMGIFLTACSSNASTRAFCEWGQVKNGFNQSNRILQEVTTDENRQREIYKIDSTYCAQNVQCAEKFLEKWWDHQTQVAIAWRRDVENEEIKMVLNKVADSEMGATYSEKRSVALTNDKKFKDILSICYDLYGNMTPEKVND